jgi:rSAM/selenodomain-associated transferase 1
MMLNRCLIVFVKYPQPGQVKSRLAKDYDDDFAADLYRSFVLDILECVVNGDWHLRIYFDPPEREVEIKKLFGNDHEYQPQCGTDLGARMKNAFDDCFSEGFKSIILIGSDFPDLSLTLIESAFAVLDSTCDAVIGPAADGGYYLIGFRNDNFLPAIFEGLTWGTPLVLEKTIRILKDKNYNMQLIDVWHDIDTGNDLLGLIERNKRTKFADSRTMNFLRASKYFYQ